MSLWEIHSRDSDFKSIFFRSDRWLKVLNFLYSEGQQTLISISAELSVSYGLISSIHPILILISSLWSDGRLFFGVTSRRMNWFPFQLDTFGLSWFGNIGPSGQWSEPSFTQ